MSDWRECVLTTLLECGTADLSLLDDVEYDVGDVLDECKEEFGDTDINNVMYIVFQTGIRRIEELIRDRMKELDGYDEMYPEEQVERKALEQLRPCADIQSYHNYLDTSVWIENNGEIYKQYLQDALDEFAEMTGFDIQND